MFHQTIFFYSKLYVLYMYNTQETYLFDTSCYFVIYTVQEISSLPLRRFAMMYDLKSKL